MNIGTKYHHITIFLWFVSCNSYVRPSDTTGSARCMIVFPTDGSADVYADCSHRNLTQVPPDLPKNITCLNLRGNNISAVDGSVWENYPYLLKLSLARNSFEMLKESYFTNLTRLQKLDISLNRIRYTNVEPSSFHSLILLKSLDMKQSLPDIWKNETYLEALQSFTEFRTLETLVIDGLSRPFSISLSSLKELYFSGVYGRCNISTISNNTFKNLSSLEQLFISHCSVQVVEFDAFKHLAKLNNLDISWNSYLQLQSLPNITSGLSKAFKRLNINSLYNHLKYDTCASVQADYLQYLNNTSLELLLTEHNNIFGMGKDTITMFPRSLKYVSVHQNIFEYGSYISELFTSSFVTKLLYLDLSHMMAVNRFLDEWWSRAALPATSLCDSMFTRTEVGDYFAAIEYKLDKYKIDEISETNASVNNKIKLDIQYLDLSANSPELIKMALAALPFINLPNLKFLNISKNYFGVFLYDNETLFENMSNLRTLDLRENSIIRLKPAIFRSQRKLETLILANNKLSSIIFMIRDIPKLKYLDIGSNDLENVPVEAQEALERIGKVKINIQDNPLKCNCGKENLKFLNWIKTTKIEIENLDSTFCSFDNSSRISLTELNYSILHRECFPPKYSVLILCSSLFLTITVLVICGGLFYRYRWNIRYLYYVIKLRFRDSPYRPLNNTEYVRDVFVPYAEEDRMFVTENIVPELEDSGHVSLFLHDRDFQPGEWVANNIVRAIRKTRKTLIVLTNAFISSKWCLFEMKMARHEEIYTGRNIICVILKEDINLDNADLPLEILDILKNKTYLEYPNTVEHFEGFWNRLRTTLNEDDGQAC